MVISLNPHQLSDACAFLSLFYRRRTLRLGVVCGLVCTAQAGGKAPVEPLAMASVAMVMVPCANGHQPDNGWKCGSSRQVCWPVFSLPGGVKQTTFTRLTLSVHYHHLIYYEIKMSSQFKLGLSPSLNYDTEFIDFLALGSQPLGLGFQNSPTMGNSIPIRILCCV